MDSYKGYLSHPPQMFNTTYSAKWLAIQQEVWHYKEVFCGCSTKRLTPWAWGYRLISLCHSTTGLLILFLVYYKTVSATWICPGQNASGDNNKIILPIISKVMLLLSLDLYSLRMLEYSWRVALQRQCLFMVCGHKLWGLYTRQNFGCSSSSWKERGLL